MTRWSSIVAMALFATACGGGTHDTSGPANRSTTVDARTELEIRRDASCETLGPRLTACAVADARATMTADEVAKLDLEKTAPKHTEEFITSCKQQQLSSRQVRVYEVCLVEETACDPLISCLDNVNAPAAE